MLTLTNYNNASGDAASILVPFIDDVKIYDVDSNDVTQYLIAAHILDGETSDSSTLEDIFGQGFVIPALVATDTPLYDEGDIRSI